MEVGGVVDGEDGGGVGEVEVGGSGGGGGRVGVVGCCFHLHVGGERESKPVVDIGGGGGALVVDATLHLLLLLLVFKHTKHTLVSRLVVVNHWGENGVIISCVSLSLSQET